jgi:hypothetical protein
MIGRVLAVLLLLTATATARARRWINMPSDWSWPPTAAMRAEGKACLSRLDELGVAWKKAPRTRKVATPIYIPAMEIGGVKLTSIWRKGPFVLDCQLARAFAERGAESLRAAGVVELRFTGIHVYRNIAGTRILSRHAVGMAMDVYQMVTEDGVVHVVEKDYPDVVLLTVESWINGCGWFRYLLTPGSDRKAHHDHFHFEARSPAEIERFTSSGGAP